MDTDRRLVRYLLGLLSDEETERLDESSIADDDIAWRLRTIENALVDDYVRGALPADIIAPFEARYLSSSARRRAKVRFAARFVRMVDAPQTAPASATEAAGAEVSAAFADVSHAAARTDRSVAPEPRFRWKPRWAFGVAAATALIVLLGALVVRDGRSRVPSADVERVHGRASEPAPTSPPPDFNRQPTVSTPAQSVIAAVLFPQTRSADGQPTITVPRDADRLALHLRLDVSDFSRYAAGLIDLSNHRTVWRSARVAPRPSADQPAVSITVPASVLTSRTYALELSGIAASGEAEVVAAYVFTIARGR
jgi:hypothetical protein